MKAKLHLFLRKYRNLLVYVLFGILTTVVNYLVYLPLYNLCHLSAGLSNIAAWLAAVLFAFFTNKPFVFKSKSWSSETVIPELLRFVGCRAVSGLLETGLLVALVDILGLNGNIVKVVLGILVFALNYIASRWLVFRKKK